MLSKNDILLLSILVSLNIIIGLISYIIGKIQCSNGVSNSKPQSFFSKNDGNSVDNNLSIDEKKVVLDIKTDNLEKKYQNFGDVKHTEETITNSVDKLKNLKR